VTDAEIERDNEVVAGNICSKEKKRQFCKYRNENNFMMHYCNKIK
jgi:hypothetical protein